MAARLSRIERELQELDELAERRDAAEPEPREREPVA